MSPTTSGMAVQLRHLIYYSLDNNNIRNAVFLAGRLHAVEPRAAEAAYLLSLSHLRLGELKAAYDYSKMPGSKGSHLGCAYVFAQSCLALERYGEGISALEKSRPLWQDKNSWNKHTETKRQHTPDAAAVYCLLGKLFQAHEETHRAIDCYSAALKINSFMWDAFQGLCDLGVNLRIPTIFQLTPAMVSYESAAVEETVPPPPTIDDSPPLNISQNPPTNIRHDPFNSIPVPQASHTSRNGKLPFSEKYNNVGHVSITPLANPYEQYGHDTFETPTNPGASHVGAPRDTQVLDETAAPEPPLAPARKTRVVAGLSTEGGPAVPARTRAAGLLPRPQSATEPEDNDSAVPTWNPSGMADRKRTASGQVSKASIASTRNNTSGLAADGGAKSTTRRSERLNNQPKAKYTDVGSIHRGVASGKDNGRELKKIKASGTKTATASQRAGRVVSGNRRIGDPMDVDVREARAIVPSGAPGPSVKTTQSERSKEQEAVKQLLELFTRLGSGYFALSHYQNKEAVSILNVMPTVHKDTPWVQGTIGRAHFEQGNYAEAAKYFKRARDLCPSRLEDLEFYSTALWHLKAEVALAHLAHVTTDQDRLSPQAWCVVGNSLSLERNHEKALVAFTRATQLEPTFAYGYTLQGHEYVATEEYDKAMAAFRAGMTADSRHYNAYYGIGKVFEKQGKYDDADRHYRIALSINPRNAVLICCIANILEKMKRPQQALEEYTRSVELAPTSHLSRFKRARLLMNMGHHEAALDDLLILKDAAPEEANVQFQLGRVYKTIGMKAEAIKHFTSAQHLDPKASHHIKEAMEQMEDDYDDDDL